MERVTAPRRTTPNDTLALVRLLLDDERVFGSIAECQAGVRKLPERLPGQGRGRRNFNVRAVTEPLRP